MFLKKAKSVTKFLGYIFQKFCSQELRKFAQSGHTEHGEPVDWRLQEAILKAKTVIE